MSSHEPAKQGLFDRRAGDRLPAEISALPLAELFPLRRWLVDRPWDLLWVRLCACIAVAPLLLLHVWGEALSLYGAAWAYALYFTALWGLFLHRCLHLRPDVWKAAAGVSVFTAFGGTALVLLVQDVPPVGLLYTAADAEGLPARALGFILGIGLVEETVKAIPLLWRVLRRKVPTTPAEGLFLGAISGLAFGAREAVLYSFSWSVAWGDGFLQGILLAVALGRLISLPLLHALLSGVTGCFVALAGTARPHARPLLVIGIGLSATLHGLYDLLVGSWGAVAIFLLSLFLFVGYAREAKHIAGVLQPTATGQAPADDTR